MECDSRTAGRIRDAEAQAPAVRLRHVNQRTLTDRERWWIAARWAWWGLLVATAILARTAFDAAAGGLQPRTWEDSRTYFEIASQPFSLDHLFSQAPLTVPLLYRLTNLLPSGVEALPPELAFWSWLGLTLTLSLVPRRWPARALGLLIGCSFLLAPLRVGWTGVVLSESINDSLAAALVTVGMLLGTGTSRLPGGRLRSLLCVGLAVALGIVGVAWLLTRDSNPISMLAAIPLLCVVGGRRRGPEQRWALPLLSVAVCVSLVALWSSHVIPPQPTGLSVHASLEPPLTARSAHPLYDNLFMRVLPDPEARSYFLARGLPDVAALDRYAVPIDEAGLRARLGPESEALTFPLWEPAALTDPELADARAWLAARGTSTYVGWLFQHPLDRFDELARASFLILAPNDLAYYMPDGFPRDGISLAGNAGVVLLLVIGFPVFLTRFRGSGFVGLGACLVLGGVAGATASYLGDAAEIQRHCYGPGQLVILGLAVGFLGWVEAGGTRGQGRRGEPIA